jgi:RNA polymerase sigma-70 factor (ECF subfamily)
MDLSVEERLRVWTCELYPELRTLAGRMVRRERHGHTLSRTALVHEALLRLMRNGRLVTSREDILGLAGHEMRLLLIDYARKHRAQRRGGGVATVPLVDSDLLTERDEDQLLAVDQALERLSRIRQRAASVVELKFFAGFQTGEIAQILGVSDGTIESDWKFAKAWLLRELTRNY